MINDRAQTKQRWKIRNTDTQNNKKLAYSLQSLKRAAVRHRHTTPQKSENAALFVRLGLPSTLIHQENGAFTKRSSCDFPDQAKFFKHKCKTNGDCCGVIWTENAIFKFSSVAWKEKAVLKFLRCSVDGKRRFQIFCRVA